ncbi:hypothetical protein F2Q68_00030986 [Brassica cretica]|uniref:Uncharacterized protein n=1 Tax=Brassica cretica TaxID=69181 RepID=A0A8S9GAQ3_BRACR|nr:hypothetical protein F2Q68_00030986 [Brassica cretica]
MADFGTPEQMAASMQQMQQQMKIDDLAAKVDLLLKKNQNQIYVMEETNLEPGTTDAAAENETSEEDQQEKEGEQPEDVLDHEQDAEQPAMIEPVALTTPDRHVPARVYTPKVPYPVPAKKPRKDCEEMKCKKMLEELNVKLSLMDAIQMIPSIRSLMKGLISGKTSADSDIMMVSKECSAVFQNRTFEMDELLKRPMLNGQNFTIDNENAALTSQQRMIEEILAYDPLEVALIRAESKHNTCNIDADGYEKMLDSSQSIEKMVVMLAPLSIPIVHKLNSIN